MIGNLPHKFTNKMEEMLGQEFDQFIASYSAPRVYGMRINTLKLSKEQWLDISPLASSTRSIPWTVDGLYYTEGERPGKHPHYHAGLYYIQEPSAMVPVELLDVRPGQRVLDLCAAPGGKSTQIAAKLQGGGVLVTNDNASERTKALAKNIELAGVRNAVVTNEEPARLAGVFQEWFDRILVDAPRSGEGMFRKDETMIADWEKHSVERCSIMQRDIMHHAVSMLAPGGVLVYSTCTFSPEENEAQIAAILAEYPELEVVQVPHRYGWQPGHPEWAGERSDLTSERLNSLQGTVRLWPHHIEGEGHYAAVLRRQGERLAASPDGVALVEQATVENRAGRQADNDKKRDARLGRSDRHKGDILRAGTGNKKGKGGDKGTDRLKHRAVVESSDAVQLWHSFAERHVPDAAQWQGRYICFGSKVYLQPAEVPSLDGLRIVRAGWYLGEAKRERFEPSHALAMGLRPEEALRSVQFASDEEHTLRYLRGETLFVERSSIQIADGTEEQARHADETAVVKGYVLVCTDGFPIGWAKYDGNMLKNELPAGWRLM